MGEDRYGEYWRIEGEEAMELKAWLSPVLHAGNWKRGPVHQNTTAKLTCTYYDTLHKPSLVHIDPVLAFSSYPRISTIAPWSRPTALDIHFRNAFDSGHTSEHSWSGLFTSASSIVMKHPFRDLFLLVALSMGETPKKWDRRG